jgi:hypothetical protein
MDAKNYMVDFKYVESHPIAQTSIRMDSMGEIPSYIQNLPESNYITSLFPFFDISSKLIAELAQTS